MNRGHLLRDCGIPEGQVDVIRKKNLDILSAGGRVATVQAAQEDSGEGQDLTDKMAGAQQAFVHMNQDGQVFHSIV